MRLASTKTAAALCGGLLLAMSVPASAAVDAKLLDMLKANGSITNAQYSELQAELARDQKDQQIARQAQQETNEQIAATAKKTEALSTFDQKLAWAAKTQFKGDVRFRQETVKNDGVSNTGDQDRQRIRVRLGAYTAINPQVDTGIRIATGSDNDSRSTNQSLDGNFTKKDIWLDRAYINWHPENVPGLKMIGGRMAQPWTKVAETEMIWDNDVNPEGVAAQYSRKFGDTNVFGSGGAFTVKDNATGFGPEFNNDLRLYYAQLGANLFPGEDFKLTVGASVFHYFKDDQGVPTQAPNAGIGLTLNGNNSTQFQLYEGFGQLDVLGLPLPLSLYGQYVQNPNANGPDDGEDRGYLLGLITRFWEIGVNYSYRDVERNAVVGAFTDSDFASGFTASKGSKLQLTYNITKNFQFLTTYFYTESDASNPAKPGAQTNTLQLDLVATF